MRMVASIHRLCYKTDRMISVRHWLHRTYNAYDTWIMVHIVIKTLSRSYIIILFILTKRKSTKSIMKKPPVELLSCAFLTLSGLQSHGGTYLEPFKTQILEHWCHRPALCTGCPLYCVKLCTMFSVEIGHNIVVLNNDRCFALRVH